MGKFGRIKRQHGRVTGLDDVLDQIIRRCPHVTRIIPGRMGRKKGRTRAQLKVQYTTGSGAGGNAAGINGLKCIYTCSGSWQEVFLICSDAEQAHRWLMAQPYTKG